MPTVISDDGRIAIVQLDDGRQIPVPSNMAPGAPPASQTGVEMYQTLSGQDVPIPAGMAPTVPAPTVPDPATQTGVDLFQTLNAPAPQVPPVDMDPVAPEGERPLHPGIAREGRVPTDKERFDRDYEAQQPEPPSVDPNELIFAPTAMDAPQDPAAAAQAQAASLGLPAAGRLSTKGIEEAARARQDAVRRKGEIGRENAAELAGLLDQSAAEMAERREQDAVAEETRQKWLAEQEEKFLSLSNEIADMRIDPGRYMANKSTAGKIVTGLAVALGGLGAGLSGGPNRALNVVLGAINNDIMAQKTNFDIKRQQLRGHQTLYSMARQRFADERSAEAVTRTIMLGETKTKVDALLARHAGTEAGANAEILSAQIQAELENSKLKVQEINNANAMQIGLAALKARAAGPQVPADLRNIDVESLPKEVRERFVPGVGLATTKEQAKTIAEAKGIYDELMGLIGRAKQLREDMPIKGSGFRFSKAQGERVSVGEQLLVKMNALEAKLGALSGEDITILRGIVPNLTNVGPVQAKLDALAKSVETTFESAVAPRMSRRIPGTEPVDEDKLLKQYGATPN